MEFETAVRPAGRISVQAIEIDHDNKQTAKQGTAKQSDSKRFKQLVQVFHEGSGAGLFELAAGRLTGKVTNSWSPGLRYWQGFGSRFLDQIC